MSASKREGSGTAWRRIAAYRPKLRSHVQIERREERGQLWYILRDAATARFHRLSPAAYLATGLMNGQRSMAEIRDICQRRLGEEEAPGPEAFARLLAQLHTADAIRGEENPDLEELWRRGAGADHRRLVARLRSPLAIRIPLFDPERFLHATRWVASLLYSPGGFAVWLAVILTALSQVGAHWSELTSNLTDRVLAAENIVVMGLVFPILKACHELGHGYAVKRWGGETHEMGIMFLVLMPVPYVDASSASGFHTKWQRFLVGAAGMYVELLIAALAFLFWIEMEPSILRSVLFNVMLIGGVTTIFFNANPLLRFDGYFILSDLIEIPNLGPRANRYIGWLIKRYLFGIRRETSPATVASEQKWLLLFGVASFCYRMLIIVSISFFVAQKFFFLGVGLAVWALFQTLILPAIKMVRWLLVAPELSGRRRRALGISGTFLAVTGLLLFVVPAPFATVIQGVIWTAEEAELTAATDGFVIRVPDVDATTVCKGCPVLSLDDPELDVQIESIEARVRAAQARQKALSVTDRVKADIVGDEIAYLRHRLSEATERRAAAEIKSPADGRLLIIGARDMEGSWVPRGDLLGYVMQPGQLVVRAVATQRQIDLIRSRNLGIRVAFAANDWVETTGHISRATPAATRELPSLALSTIGGGEIALDPARDEAPQSLEDVFLLEIALDGQPAKAQIAQRAYVRIAHGSEPVGLQIWRSLRQLILRKFDV